MSSKKLAVIPLDPEDFRAWLERQGPVVGTARKEPMSAKKAFVTTAATVGLGAGFALATMFRPLARDESPLARYVSEKLGQRVRLYLHAVAYQRSTPIGTLPEWAWAFDAKVQQRQGQVVTKDEALAALAQVVPPTTQTTA